MVFCVGNAILGIVGGVEGGLHGGAFDGPVCYREVLEDEYEYGYPKEEANCSLGCRTPAEASVEGAKLSGCAFCFQDGFLDDLLGL